MKTLLPIYFNLPSLQPCVSDLIFDNRFISSFASTSCVFIIQSETNDATDTAQSNVLLTTSYIDILPHSIP
jgi:hypothetical protein